MAERLVQIEQPQHAELYTPHLSYSRIQKYLTCPEQYRLHYIEKLRPRVQSASLVFGSVMHLTLAEYFRRGANPVETFNREWQALHSVEMRYSRSDSWQKLKDTGNTLLRKFCQEEAWKFGRTISVEQPFTLGFSNLDRPLIGTIDLVAEVQGKRTVIDFKTAASDFENYEVVLADQLTVYALAEPAAEQFALCVFVKAREPRVEWHMTQRLPEQAIEYLDKAEAITEQIRQGVFYKRVGNWCRRCDFLPECLGDEKKAQDTLVQLI